MFAARTCTGRQGPADHALSWFMDLILRPALPLDINWDNLRWLFAGKYIYWLNRWADEGFHSDATLSKFDNISCAHHHKRANFSVHWNNERHCRSSFINNRERNFPYISHLICGTKHHLFFCAANKQYLNRHQRVAKHLVKMNRLAKSHNDRVRLETLRHDPHPLLETQWRRVARNYYCFHQSHLASGGDTAANQPVISERAAYVTMNI